MILVDTSVWIEHFRASDGRLAAFISQGRVLQHPYVTGEIVVGNLRKRNRSVWALRNLPRIEPVDDDGFHDFLEAMLLAGTGLGFVDIHLLAAAHRHGAVKIWTRDRRMLEQAERLELACSPLP